VREIRLYDSLTGRLVPVSAGDAIRVEVRSPPCAPDGTVDVGSTRPFALFSFLERFLRREGFGTKFLFDSPGGEEDMLYELSDDLAPLSAPEQDRTELPNDAEIDLLEVPRGEVEQWVNVCFGAGRDGEDWPAASPSRRIALNKALKHFGHPAVALYLLGTHYSLPLGDPFTGLVTGSRNAQRIRDVLPTLAIGEPSPADMSHHLDAFRDALAEDLDTPLALVVLFEWVLEAERREGGVGDSDLRAMLDLFELEDLVAPVGAS
jgi:hypothetical protein